MNFALFFAVLTAAADCGYAYLNYDVEYHQRHHARRKFNVCEKRLRFNFDKIASNDYIIAPDTRVNAVIKFRDISQMHKHELRRILLPHEDRVSIIVSQTRADAASKTGKQLSGTKGEKRERWNDGRRITLCNAVL